MPCRIETEIVAFEQEDATQLAKLETERQAIEEESMRYRRARMTELVSRVANAEALAAEYREKLNDLETSAALSHQHIVHIEASAAQLPQKIRRWKQRSSRNIKSLWIPNLFCKCNVKKTGTRLCALDHSVRC